MEKKDKEGGRREKTGEDLFPIYWSLQNAAGFQSPAISIFASRFATSKIRHIVNVSRS